MAKLKKYAIESFAKGYNFYAASRSMIEDEEIPQGAYNVVLAITVQLLRLQVWRNTQSRLPLARQFEV